MRLPVFIAAILIFQSLAGCAAPEPAVIDPPQEMAEAVEPFLAALRAGDREEAELLISDTATDELATQFAADHKLLAAAPMLTPRFLLPQQDLGLDQDNTETTLVYAARKDGKWTSATIRLNQFDDEPAVVEYWRITNTAPQPVLFSTNEQKAFRQVLPGVLAALIGTGFLGLLLVIGLIWIVRRKPHLVNPEIETDMRDAAVSTREEEQK
jgi:hypothetical protein